MTEAGVTPSFELVAATLPWAVDPSIALAAARAGAIGVLDLEYALDVDAACASLERMVGARAGRVGVKLDARSAELLAVVSSLPPHALEMVIVVPGTGDETRAAVTQLRRVAQRILIEVRCAAEAALGESLELDGLIAKGNEAGGRVARESTFVLLQRSAGARGRLLYGRTVASPVLTRLPKACFAGGAARVRFWAVRSP